MFAFSAVLAQPAGRQVAEQQLIWYAYYNTLEFNPKWYLTTEIDERRFRKPDRQHQFLVRSHLHYLLGKNWDASLGFAYFLQSPQDPYATDRLVVPELRPHVQLDYRQPLGRLAIIHRYRAEKRFFRNTANGELAAGYTTNYRFRYRVGIEYTIINIKEQPLRLRLNNEVMLNAGKSIGYNWFDQYRVYAGLGYPVLKDVNVEAAYIYWYQQRPTGNQFYERDIIRFVINHKINLKKEKQAEQEQ